MDVLVPIIGVGIIMLIFCGPLLIPYSDDKPTKKIEYIEYGSSPFLESIWNDYSLIGKCDRCGMADAPVHPTPFTNTLCKYCKELDALNTHLQTHGSRKMHGL